MASRLRDGMMREIGLLSRLASSVTTRHEPGVSVAALELPGGALLSIVGESHRQPALEKTAKLATSVPPLPVTVELRGN